MIDSYNTKLEVSHSVYGYRVAYRIPTQSVAIFELNVLKASTISKYDQEIPQSHTADQPTAL